ncbi:MAG: hypothetical protein JWO52_4829 [Gammaproteobacteria bacterium]|nr:hypothetical protein [Gammaproteobacteria bacterium]
MQPELLNAGTPGDRTADRRGGPELHEPRQPAVRPRDQSLIAAG